MSIQAIRTHLAEKRAAYAILTFILLCALSAGVVTARELPNAESALGGALSRAYPAHGLAAFWSTSWLHIRFYALTALCALFLWGVVPAGMLVAVRGFLTGFSIGLIGSQVQGLPMLGIGLCMLPALVLILVAQLAASVIASDAALFTFKAGIRLPMLEKLNYIAPSLVAIAGLFMLSLTGAAFELAVIPGLLARLLAV